MLENNKYQTIPMLIVTIAGFVAAGALGWCVVLIIIHYLF
jgi:hypothetical protein